MRTWLVIFIILCVFYGPVYLTVILLTIMNQFITTGGPIGWFLTSTLIIILFGAPLAVTGYMAFKNN